MSLLLEACQLTKCFGRVTALSGRHLRAESSQILALLGPARGEQPDPCTARA